MSSGPWSAELALAGAGGEPVDLWRSIQSHGLVDLPPMVCWVGGTLIGSVAGDALLVQAGTPADPDAGLRAWLGDWARNHPRRGFRPTYHDARAEGWQVNHKKVQRLP